MMLPAREACICQIAMPRQTTNVSDVRNWDAALFASAQEHRAATTRTCVSDPSDTSEPGVRSS
jgi:hypothetical protein